MNIDPEKITLQMIKLYEGYLENPLNESLRLDAELLYNDLRGAQQVISETLWKSVGPLQNIGLRLKPLPTEDQVCHILSALRHQQ